MLLIFLGAPGSGKGTVSEQMISEYKFKHISTGNIFRETIKSNSELGNKVKSIIESGRLVDDQVTWEVAKGALEKIDLDNENVILDGYPRNIAQAKLLEEWVSNNKINSVKQIYFEVEEEEILKRLTGRMMCKDCGTIYHKVFNPPKIEGKCDKDGSDLYQREDDKLENVKVRLETYDEVTKPLIEYYSNKDLITIDGVKTKNIPQEIMKKVK